ncbi:MAG: glycosyltransferase family 4 protein [Candidatus Peregrinibacteria bacterium]
MKKILLYTDTPQIGGAEHQTYLLAKFLDKRKFTPILACSHSPALDKWCRQFEQEGIKVIRLNVSNKHDPRHHSQLKKILKEQKIDLLHAQVWNPASCRYAYTAAKATKTPLMTTEHDPFPLPLLKDIFKKQGLKNVQRIIAISKNNKQLLQKLYPAHKDKIQLVLNGIDTLWWQSQILRFTELDLEKIKTETFQANEDTLIIISIAELHERKGLKFLISAMPEIIKSYPNTKLVIVGEGPDRKNLEKLIRKLKMEDHIILLGRKKEIPHLLKASNIFVLPSKREAFGLVNLEAMLTPLAVVATKVGGIPDIISHQKTGLLVRPQDTPALARTLKQLIASPVKRKKMAKAGKSRALKLFSAKKMALAYEKIYSKILS